MVHNEESLVIGFADGDVQGRIIVGEAIDLSKAELENTLNGGKTPGVVQNEFSELHQIESKEKQQAGGII